MEWKSILQSSINPTSQSHDPRNHQEKTIFAVDNNLSELVGKEVVVKIAEKSGDGLTPEMQFEAGKILEKEILQLGLNDFVAVNRAFGYIQQGNRNYLFLEKVHGHNFQQLQKGEEGGIPDSQIEMIFDKLIEKLNQIKNTISTDPDFIKGKKLFHQSKLQSPFYSTQTVKDIIFSNQDDSEFNSKYPFSFSETNSRYKTYYADHFQKIERLEILIKRLGGELKNPYLNKYNLISDVILRILALGSILSVSYYNEINKSSSYGQDNLMWDKIKKKIIIIDPGPPIRKNKR